jgi:hypothetical protein
MRLFHRKPRWQDDWTVEIVEAERKSQPGVTSAWGWNIIETNWEAMAEMARIMSALGDPEQRDRHRAYLSDPEARYVYRSRWGVLDEPDPYPRWYPTEKDARDAATAIADLLWNRFGRLRVRRP